MRTYLRVLWLRVRVTIARNLLIGTGCEVARTGPIEETMAAAWALREYIQRSGGLNQPAIPRRLRAFRRIMTVTDDMHQHARQIALPQ